MKIKKWVIVLVLIIAVFAVGIVSLVSNMKKNTSVYNSFNFSELNMEEIPDGTYTGSEDGSLVKATVEVTVKDHTITKVSILSHDNGKGKPAEVITDSIVKQNSLEVDTVSGATYSSNVIRMAVFKALTK